MKTPRGVARQGGEAVCEHSRQREKWLRQALHSCSIEASASFIGRLLHVSLYCRTLVAVSTSVQIRQAPSTFHPEHQVCMLVARHSWPCCSTSSYRVVHDCARPLSAFLAD